MVGTVGVSLLDVLAFFEDLADPCLEIVVVMDVTFIVGLELV